MVVNNLSPDTLGLIIGIEMLGLVLFIMLLVLANSEMKRLRRERDAYRDYFEKAMYANDLSDRKRVRANLKDLLDRL